MTYTSLVFLTNIVFKKKTFIELNNATCFINCFKLLIYNVFNSLMIQTLVQIMLMWFFESFLNTFFL